MIDYVKLTEDFLKNKHLGIKTLYTYAVKDYNQLEFDALLLLLKEELIAACISFYSQEISKDEDEQDQLNSYLFYVSNAYIKKQYKPKESKVKQYICPVCVFFKKESILDHDMTCHICTSVAKTNTNPKYKLLFDFFAKVQKSGFKCPDCKRFLQKQKNNIISCPYLDCCYHGSVDGLVKIKCPSIAKTIYSSKDEIISDNNPISLIEEKDELTYKVSLIKEIIQSQSNNIVYCSSNFTTKHKQLIYRSILELLIEYPQEMVAYLLDNSRSGGFQHKIFQRYISMLEKELPFAFLKRKKVYRVESLLDDNLDIFKSIETFTATIDDNLKVKNNTENIYIGGRKASYVKPFYIGKLLSVVDNQSKKSYIDNVIEYSFSKIKFKDIQPGTKVKVTHLSISPHYQMGPMAHINRIRKKIIEKVKIKINES